MIVIHSDGSVTEETHIQTARLPPPEPGDETLRKVIGDLRSALAEASGRELALKMTLEKIAEYESDTPAGRLVRGVLHELYSSE